jgi:hypothetical protein
LVATVTTNEKWQQLAGTMSAWSWPISREQMATIASGFGWTLFGDGSRLIWDTEAEPGASAAVVDGAVARLTVATSDYLDDDAAGKRALRDLYADQVDAVTAVLGTPTERKPGRSPATTWELANGSALKVGSSAGGCYWVVTSPEFVEVQRDLGSDA